MASIEISIFGRPPEVAFVRDDSTQKEIDSCAKCGGAVIHDTGKRPECEICGSMDMLDGDTVERKSTFKNASHTIHFYEKMMGP